MSESVRTPLVVAIVALVAALAAAGVAITALLDKPEALNSGSAPTPTSEQVSAARTRTCDNFKKVASGVGIQTHTQPEDNPTSGQAVAANARLSMLGGGTYLLDNIDPAAPGDLNDAVKAFAGTLQTVAVNALAGIGNDAPDQAGLLQKAQSETERIEALCE
ncbi:hypothetical protein [Mycolicibacterium neworleansense]|uniref:Putative alanine and proline rich membrane protein n=1 Tax=Mycolicibacterium neworleansense TaxID=146018 RepID=A0A0H5RT32_9MYCO|nr:hypothetical protein [Mycolicibacterium neworleansense]MCV7361310.1 hypothetical protein [Mycolicibacterium neworleansense]CRZ16657.1 putative alanine and proline rich membrane protein [Mycolicibacterium neworleansense]